MKRIQLTVITTLEGLSGEILFMYNILGNFVEDICIQKHAHTIQLNNTMYVY